MPRNGFLPSPPPGPPRGTLTLGILTLLICVPAAAQTAHDSHHAAQYSHGASHAECPFQAGSGSPAPTPDARPTLPGQDAFGAIAEIVTLLEADPETDWSRVSIARLRAHLVDMNEVALRAEARERVIPGGLEIEVGGPKRTLDALRRMVPAHSAMMRSTRPWTIEAVATQEHVKLTLEAEDPQEVDKLRALGFFGFMAAGDHHRPHHLAMARGMGPH